MSNDIGLNCVSIYVTFPGAQHVELPEDSESLKAMVRALLLECEREKQRAVEQARLAEESKQRGRTTPCGHAAPATGIGAV